MKAKVIETGEIVNVLPYPTIYQEKGQGPDRREWYEDELEFIYSNKKKEKLDLEKEIKDYIQALPPELKENENEKIRKTLIDFFQTGAKNNETTNGINDTDILAWFEKQGEQRLIDWSKEDEEILGWLCTFLKEYGHEFYYGGNEENVIDWLKSLKDRMQLQ